jgi:hypothetical protein
MAFAVFRSGTIKKKLLKRIKCPFYPRLMAFSKNAVAKPVLPVPV